MLPNLAALIFTAGIAALFYLDRERVRVSKALWIPTIWLFFCSSQSPAQWLGLDSGADLAGTYTDGSPFDRNILILLQVIALCVLSSRRRRLGPILRQNWAIGLFYLYAGLSMAWSDYPFITLKHWIKGIGDVMMVLIVLSEPNIAEAVKRLVTRLGFVLVPLSLLFIWYFPSIGRTHTMDWTPEAVGVATQKNMLGELCDIFGLALVWRFRNVYSDRKDPNRSQRLLALGAVLAMVVWCLHLSHSMTSTCAFTMAGTVMLLSNWRPIRRRPTYVYLFIPAVVACTVYALFFQSSGSLIQGLGRDATLTGRTDAWPEFLRLVHNQLIGVGYESFWLGDRLQRVWVITKGLKVNEAHSGYVELLLTLGWIGVILMGTLILTGYRNVMAAYRRDPRCKQPQNSLVSRGRNHRPHRSGVPDDGSTLGSLSAGNRQFLLGN